MNSSNRSGAPTLQRSNVLFSRFALATLITNVLVILWGAHVRASGSGDGCGTNWPLCHGALIPSTMQAEVVIEWFHRLSSGIGFLMVVALFLLAWRLFPRGHAVRRSSVWALIGMLIESLVGAGIVLFGLTGTDASLARVALLAVHLGNTYILLAALLLCWQNAQREIKLHWHDNAAVRVIGAGLVLMLILGASGTIAALSTTLFPARSLADGLRQYGDPLAPPLVHWRSIHPIMAALCGLYLMIATWWLRLRYATRATFQPTIALNTLFVLQASIGLFNIALLAPNWLRMIHLTLAIGTWLQFILLAVAVLSETTPQPVVITGLRRFLPSWQPNQPRH